MNQRALISRQFYQAMGYGLNLREPRTFSEKIQWTKLFWQDSLLTHCADKVTCKDYVRQKLGRDICLPTLATYGAAAEFDPSALPDGFALKLNCGSGHTLICHDQAACHPRAIQRQLAGWLRPEANHYYHSYEWAYREITPRIIAEPVIGDTGGLGE